MPFVFVGIIALFVGYKAAKMYQKHRIISKQFTPIPSFDRSKYDQFYDLPMDNENDLFDYDNYTSSNYLNQVEKNYDLTWVK